MEESPKEPRPKRKKIEKKQMSKIEDYIPSQSPFHIGEEHLSREKIEQLWSQGRVFITVVELEDANP